MRNEIDIAVVAEGIGLPSSRGLFFKTGGKRLSTQQELRRAVYILDACVRIVALFEA